MVGLQTVERGPHSLFRVCHCSHNNLGKIGCLRKCRCIADVVFNFQKIYFLFLCFLIHIFSLKVSQCLRNLFSLLGLLVKCHFLFFKKSFFRSTFVSCSFLLLKQRWFTMLCYFLLHSGVRQPCVYTRPFPVGGHGTLSGHPCAVHQVPTDHLLRVQKCASAILNPPVLDSPLSVSKVTDSLCSQEFSVGLKLRWNPGADTFVQRNEK